MRTEEEKKKVIDALLNYFLEKLIESNPEGFKNMLRAEILGDVKPEDWLIWEETDDLEGDG
jgi:hypothetical protein